MVLLRSGPTSNRRPSISPEIKLALFNTASPGPPVAYGALGIMAAWAFDGWRRPAVYAIILASIFGATDELHQSFVPGRRSGIDDWAFDTFSAALALYLWPRFKRWRPR
jgi:hypothetical protein